MKYVFVLNTVLYTCLLSVISDQLICPVYEKCLRFQAEKAYQLIGPKVFLLIKIRVFRHPVQSDTFPWSLSVSD